jgi:hypothetical protein
MSRRAPDGTELAIWAVIVALALIAGWLAFTSGAEFTVSLWAVVSTFVLLVGAGGFVWFSGAQWALSILTIVVAFIWPLWWKFLASMANAEVTRYSLIDDPWYVSGYFKWGIELTLLAAAGYFTWKKLNNRYW